MGLIRLAIWGGLIYFGYKVVKSKVLQHISYYNTVSGSVQDEADDIMIKDPYCEIYFPKREGIRLNIDHQELYFCSEVCRDKFLLLRSRK